MQPVLKKVTQTKCRQALFHAKIQKRHEISRTLKILINFSYFCLYEAKTVCQLLITSALQGHFGEFLALEEVQVDGIFEASGQVPNVCNISPIYERANKTSAKEPSIFAELPIFFFQIVTQIHKKKKKKSQYIKDKNK